MSHSLRYRLMTALLVCILPIGLVSCVLFGILMNRMEQEVHISNQARLQEAMAYWEEDSTQIDWYMEYFFSQYSSELNYENLSWSDVTRYTMFLNWKKSCRRPVMTAWLPWLTIKAGMSWRRCGTTLRRMD